MSRYKIRGLAAANSAYSPRSRGCRIPIALAALILGSPAWGATPISDVDHPAPFDYGFGLGVRVPSGSISAWNKMLDLFSLRHETPFQTQADIGRLPHALVAPPTAGPPDAAQTGMFGSVLPWPIIPLHMALLPNGQVMTYGTDENGKQGAALYFDVWDPTQPYETSQTVLANTTGTDIFCSGMGLLTNGSLLITGGDLTINGKRNYSNAQVNLYAPGAAALTPNGVMNYPRWYPADVPLSNGDQMIVGGRSNQDPTVPVTTPEYYSVADNTFTPLTGAQESTNLSWFYPRVFVDSTGAIDLFDASGRIAVLSAAGSGSIAESTLKLQRGLDNLPTVMYAPGQILSLRNAPTAGADGYTYPVQAINVAGPMSIEAAPAAPGPGRQWANLTVLADGTLLLNGGSSPANQLQNVSTTSYLFSPANQVWTPAATAAEPRLYHSAALLLPDGTVLTGGGGAPGPVNELNAEIYYPPYLFVNDGSGNFATRPLIASAPTTIAPGTPFTLTMADNSTVAAVNLIRLGQVTHSTSLQSRFVSASFSQTGQVVTITPTANVNDLLTGYWMVFVFNTSGTPAIAPIVQVPPPG